MIKVTVRYDLAGQPTGFSCRGHAGYQTDGEDIICAAVTTLAATLISSLTDLLQVEDLTFHLNDGDIGCQLGPSALVEAGDVGQVKLLFQAFELGCRQIAYSYDGKYVQVEEA